jgi:glycosyltransferase involved in cell wall biosynthesis
MTEISVVVMAFNEAKTLELVVRDAHVTLSGLKRPYELVIINDGSSDGTGIIADRLAKELADTRVIHHEFNQGLGRVYRSGFSHSKGEFITFLPADGQFSAANIKLFLAQINDADMVLGYLPKRPDSLLAKGLSKAEKILYRLLFGSFPKFQGLFMFRRSLLNELELKSPDKGRGWAVVMELILRVSKGKYKIINVPTEICPRASGKSKVNNFPTIWANLKQVFVLRRHF